MPPEMQLTFAGVRESGAPLAIWAPTPVSHSDKIAARVGSVPFPLKPLPTEAEVQHELERCQDRALQERLHRKRAQIRFLGPGPTCDVSYWIWTVGNAVFVAQPNEAYSDFQVELRRTFPDHPVIVMNLSNGASGSYLYPARLAVEDVYQVWVSPFGRDALSLLIDACREAIKIISGTV